MRFVFLPLLIVLALISPALAGENLSCGRVEDGHEGTIPEWPNEPVEFSCERGFSELSLCILNRENIDVLQNGGPQFIAIFDGDAIYAITRDNHEAYTMIVRRKVVEQNGKVHIQTSACGYGDKAASDQLIAAYKELDQQIMEQVNTADENEGSPK